MKSVILLGIMIQELMKHQWQMNCLHVKPLKYQLHHHHVLYLLHSLVTLLNLRYNSIKLLFMSTALNHLYSFLDGNMQSRMLNDVIL